MDLRNKKVLVIAHVLTSVPAEDLKKFLLENHVKNLLYIGHPLYYKEGRPGSFREYYKDGTLLDKKQLGNWNINQFIRFIIDFTLTLYWVAKSKDRWDIAIALDNLNAVSALTLRMLGKIDKVIYYTIDFTPQRFPNKMINDFYHFIDRIAVRYSNLTWNISPRISEGRSKVRNLSPSVYTKQTVVPVGVWLDRIKPKEFNEINPHRIVYAGSLSEHQGIQLVIEALPKIREVVPDVDLTIIGLGNYEKELKHLTTKLGLEEVVKFLGYLEKMEDVEEITSKCGVAVAMYSEELSKWSYYADPSKIKTYLAVGLPVVTTSLTYIAKEVSDRKCGVVCEYNTTSLVKAITQVITQPDIHKEYRKNALEFAKEFSWNRIFTEGLGGLHASDK